MLREVILTVFLKKRRGKFVVVCIKWVCHPYVGSAIALPDRCFFSKHKKYMVVSYNAITKHATLTSKCWHFKKSALQKSFKDTWHSRRSASAQSNKSNVNPNWGLCEDDGHIRALTMVTTNGSHSQLAKETLYSSP